MNAGRSTWKHHPAHDTQLVAALKQHEQIDEIDTNQ
jgi:hypothetical protein